MTLLRNVFLLMISLHSFRNDGGDFYDLLTLNCTDIDSKMARFFKTTSL